MVEPIPESRKFLNLSRFGSPPILISWLIALLPVMLVFITWDRDGHLSDLAYVIRNYSIPVSVCELIIIWVAARLNFDLLASLMRATAVQRWLIGIWLFFAMGSAFLASGQVEESVFVTIRYFLHGLLFVSLIHIYKHEDKSIFYIAITLTIGAALYFLSILIFLLFIEYPRNFDWVHRLPSATNIRQIGYYFSLMAVAPLTLLLFCSRKSVVFYGLCLSACTCFMAWSGSRGGLFGIVVGAIFALVWQRSKPSWKRLLSSFCFAAIGIAVSIGIPIPAPEFGILRIFNSLAETQDVSTGRTEFWMLTIKHLNTGSLWGHGSGTFRQNMGLPFNHPHQFILQYLYDWGMVGGLAALLLLAFLAFRVLQQARSANDAAGYCAVAGLTTILCIASIDGALFMPLSIVLALLLITPCLAQSQAKRPIS